MDERFGKEYKLCSKTIMDNVFANGRKINSFPFLLKYQVADVKTEKKFQILISVPKKKMKRAVDRNRMKRLIREGVRKNKKILEEGWKDSSQQFALILIYLSEKEESYEFIKNKIEALFLRLVNELPTFADNKTS